MTVCRWCLDELKTSIDYTDEDRKDILCDTCGEVITGEYIECDDGTCRCMECIEDTHEHWADDDPDWYAEDTAWERWHER